MGLKGKNALVTGAGRMHGLGHAIAVALARAQVNVAITSTGRSADSFPDVEKRSGWADVHGVAEEVERHGVRSLPLTLDIRDAASVASSIDEVVQAFGSLDILVNNAAAPKGDDRLPLVDLDERNWREVLEINLTGTFQTAKYAARQMIAQGRGGSIVNISSMHGRRAAPNIGAYAVSKQGLTALNRSLAIELAAHRINVNCVAPGVIETSRTRDVIQRLYSEPAEIRRLIPLGRTGTPEEVASAVLFLASPQAAYITGQILYVDGGVCMD